jgi:hypothetical protein
MAGVIEIVTYRWGLPDDTAPLLRLTDALRQHEVIVLLAHVKISKPRVLQCSLQIALTGVMAALWEEAVVRPVERLSDESAGELPEDIRSANLVPFARPVLA